MHYSVKIPELKNVSEEAIVLFCNKMVIFSPLGLKAIGNSLDFATDAISREEETDIFTAMFTPSALAILAFFYSAPASSVWPQGNGRRVNIRS